MLDWETYLCFIIGRDGKVAFSPQGSTFLGRDPGEFSADREANERMNSAIRDTLEHGLKVPDFLWKAKYGKDEVREYRVAFDTFEDNMILVRLYRHEAPRFEITSQESQILQALMEDLTDDDIAELFLCTKSTVRRHIHNLRNKIGVQGRAKLAIEAFRLGLVESKNESRVHPKLELT